jgi:hypothetical protein
MTTRLESEGKTKNLTFPVDREVKTGDPSSGRLKQMRDEKFGRSLASADA